MVQLAGSPVALHHRQTDAGGESDMRVSCSSNDDFS